MSDKFTLEELRELRGRISQGEWKADKDELATLHHEEQMQEYSPEYRSEYDIYKVHVWRNGGGTYVADTGCHDLSEPNARAIAMLPDLLDQCIRYRTALEQIADSVEPDFGSNSVIAQKALEVGNGTES